MKYPIVISYHSITNHITANLTSYLYTLSPRKKNLSSNSKRIKKCIQQRYITY